MKIKLLFVFAIVLSTVLTGCTEKGYMITGNISGDADGKTVYLYSGIGPFFVEENIVDSTVISGGKFEFRGELTNPDVYTLKFFTGDSRSSMGERGYAFRPLIPLFVSKGQIMIDADFDSIPLDKLSTSGINFDYSKIDVTGPADLALFIDYSNEKAKLLDAYLADNRDYSRFYSRGSIAEKFAAVEKSDAAYNKIKEYAMRFVEQNVNNVIGVWAFGDNIGRFTVAEIDRLSGLFTEEIKNSSLGAKILEKAADIRSTAVGAPFYDYSFFDAQGNPVKLSDHVGKGSYVLLEFWASWCGPCRADIPHLKEVYELYHPVGFDIISISMDADEKAWKGAFEKEQMAWLQVTDLKAFDGDIAKIYNFSGIPACVLVGPDGLIAHRNFRGPRMDMGLIELYGNRFDDNN